jgi:hypothetical protein
MSRARNLKRRFSPMAVLAALVAISTPLSATMPSDPTSPGPVLLGRVGGAFVGTDRVPARMSHTYNMRFWAGDYASIAVSGDGDTDLDLFVYDELGNLIASDIDGTDECVVTWMPAWTGNFRVEIHNLGYVSNVYSIASN